MKKIKEYIRSYVEWYRDKNGSQQVIISASFGLLIFILWASVARVDEVTRGEGRVIPSSKAQIAQSSEPAIIKDILVRSGQLVRKGQLLVRLDDSESSSQFGQIAAENRSLEARAARLSREGGVDDQVSCTPDANGAVPDECKQEAMLQSVRKSALQSKMSALQSVVEQRRRDYGEAQATISSLQTSLRLAQSRVNMLAPLAAKSIVPQTDLLDAQRELSDIQGRLGAAQQSASRATAAISEAQSQATEAGFQFKQEALNERSQLASKIAVNNESLRGAASRVSRSEIRSPVNGVVNDVQVTTIGGFVQAGQKILQVVPIGEKLLVEARVSPRDIAFIKVNDRANVKVTAYDFSIYGGLTGRVVQVSADSIYDETKKEAYFSVVVETDRSYLMSSGKRLPISPGMICNVEIITGHKSILRYLLKPVLRARAEALSER